MIDRGRFKRVASAIQSELSLCGLKVVPIKIEDTEWDGFGTTLAKWSPDRPAVALYAGNYLTSSERTWWFGFEAPAHKEAALQELPSLKEFKPVLEFRFVDWSSIPLVSPERVIKLERHKGIAFDHEPEFSYFGKYLLSSSKYSDRQVISGAIQFISGIVEALDPLLAERRDVEALGKLDKTTRKQLIDARRGQGIFRRKLEDIWNGCGVLGCEKREVLRASHIKPWSLCSDEERLSADNGLLLTATLDALFDKHLISFEDDGTLLVADSLSANDRRALKIDGRLRLLRKPSRKQCKFLAFHRASAERRWGSPLSSVEHVA